ncbi:ketosteroid isomerase-like protein [Nocardioides zeae]|uniref:Ketosteroid isomerase-like protein n=1 Tax=Nocardioides zeae TaxID=1457234 RepID=A0ACC6IJ93_9ACTN|nr:nuclear transport factor 2 family protein [Nocardioides zeae]MDR6174685.1 ketosteroid isomerase-like protein [Nocardioides zeae]MDR6210754.1 ketosteroid isomerase-like protein [Nocardioides zeae]
MATPNHLTRYYADVDAGDIDAAQARLHPEVTFAIHLPAGSRRGTTSEEMVRYLRDRGPVDRAHRPLRTGVDDDLEFVYGAVVEDGVTTTGHFLAAVRVVDGLITRYQVSFDVELALLGVDA